MDGWMFAPAVKPVVVILRASEWKHGRRRRLPSPLDISFENKGSALEKPQSRSLSTSASIFSAAEQS